MEENPKVEPPFGDEENLLYLTSWINAVLNNFLTAKLLDEVSSVNHLLKLTDKQLSPGFKIAKRTYYRSGQAWQVHGGEKLAKAHTLKFLEADWGRLKQRLSNFLELLAIEYDVLYGFLEVGQEPYTLWQIALTTFGIVDDFFQSLGDEAGQYPTLLYMPHKISGAIFAFTGLHTALNTQRENLKEFTKTQAP